MTDREFLKKCKSIKGRREIVTAFLNIYAKKCVKLILENPRHPKYDIINRAERMGKTMDWILDEIEKVYQAGLIGGHDENNQKI